MKNQRGYIVLIGGAEDRTYDKEVLKHIVTVSQAKHIALIPTATDYPTEAHRDYTDAFRDLGVHEVSLLDIRYKDEADNPKYFDMLDAADVIFFTGGDQERLVRILAETELIRKIKMRNEEGATIAGTSAGAAAAGDPMIFKGNGHRGFQKGSVSVKKGFGFLEGIVVDTHFMARCRIPRLAQILSTGAAFMGIGLCEDTAAAFSPDNTFEVVGSNTVTVLNGSRLAYSNYHDIQNNDRVAMDGIRMSFLTSGIVYDLKKESLYEEPETEEDFSSFSVEKPRWMYAALKRSFGFNI